MSACACSFVHKFAVVFFIQFIYVFRFASSHIEQLLFFRFFPSQSLLFFRFVNINYIFHTLTCTITPSHSKCTLANSRTPNTIYFYIHSTYRNWYSIIHHKLNGWKCESIVVRQFNLPFFFVVAVVHSSFCAELFLFLLRISSKDVHVINRER